MPLGRAASPRGVCPRPRVAFRFASDAGAPLPVLDARGRAPVRVVEQPGPELAEVLGAHAVRGRDDRGGRGTVAVGTYRHTSENRGNWPPQLCRSAHTLTHGGRRSDGTVLFGTARSDCCGYFYA